MTVSLRADGIGFAPIAGRSGPPVPEEQRTESSTPVLIAIRRT
ncbi:hypothetical protein BURCENBC7_AP0701 [Burkholderia cenocepacia BC7]|nr:hypothetical protein BURCENBC7_AP0701 [Burkholderia cenocepacia BC7]